METPNNWKEYKSFDGEKILRYHLSDPESSSIDVVEIIEGEHKVVIKYDIRPNQEYDLLTIETSDGLYAEIKYPNDREHEDPWFTYESKVQPDEEGDNTGTYDMIYFIKKYIINEFLSGLYPS